MTSSKNTSPRTLRIAVGIALWLGVAVLAAVLFSEHANRPASQKLAYAVIRVDIPTVERLLGEEDVDVNWMAPSSPEGPILCTAVATGSAELVQMLLQAGANPNLCAPGGMCPLLIATMAGHAEVVRILIGRGVSLDQQEAQAGSTALIVASEKGSTEIVRILIGAGADPRIKTKAGSTARQLAERHGRAEIAAMLKKYEETRQSRPAFTATATSPSAT